jgi:hypothetical protein
MTRRLVDSRPRQRSGGAAIFSAAYVNRVRCALKTETSNYRKFEDAKIRHIRTRKHHDLTEKKPTEIFYEELRHEFNHYGTYFSVFEGVNTRF